MIDRDKMTALEKDQRDAVARLLSPAELLEYDLRASNTANSLREELAAFQPTEAEFRSIYDLRAAFDQRFNTFTADMGSIGMSQEQQRQRSDAQKILTEQIKALLGPARMAEYERATDFNYRRTSQFVARLELPPETTNQLYAIQKEFEQRRSEMYRAGIPSREAMTEQMTALQQQAIARVTPVLRSASAVESYKQYGGGWINNLVPRFAPPRPVAPK
jgi:hypothetical protein